MNSETNTFIAYNDYSKQKGIYYVKNYLAYSDAMCNIVKDKSIKILDDIIISLTSYPARISYVIHTLKSLLIQEDNEGNYLRPEKIILVLSREEFNFSANHKNCDSETSQEISHLFYEVPKDFPEDLRKLMLENSCIEIMWIDENTKSYKKLIPTYEKYTNKNIITVDDDILYPKYMIRDIYQKHLESPGAIIYRGAFDYNPNEDFKELLAVECIKNYPIILGCCGTLYPPNSLSKFVFNKVYQRLCSTTDDIWFTFMGMLNKTKFVYAPSKECMVIAPVSNIIAADGLDNITSTLAYQNTNNQNNKLCFLKMKSIFPEVFINDIPTDLSYINDFANLTDIQGIHRCLDALLIQTRTCIRFVKTLNRYIGENNYYDFNPIINECTAESDISISQVMSDPDKYVILFSNNDVYAASKMDTIKSNNDEHLYYHKWIKQAQPKLIKNLIKINGFVKAIGIEKDDIGDESTIIKTTENISVAINKQYKYCTFIDFKSNNVFTMRTDDLEKIFSALKS